MPNYHIKVVKGRKEKPHHCEGYTVTVIPSQGYYAENPHLLGLPAVGYYDRHPNSILTGLDGKRVPEGQRIMFELEVHDAAKGLTRQVIYLPKDGTVAYVLDAHNNGNTIDTYPKKRDRQVEVKPEQEFGLKVGQNG